MSMSRVVGDLIAADQNDLIVGHAGDQLGEPIAGVAA
jgi:hypothetical protein